MRCPIVAKRGRGTTSAEEQKEEEGKKSLIMLKLQLAEIN